MTILMIRSIFILLLSLTVCELSAQTPRLDKHHLLLDAGVGEGEKRDFVFTTFQEAVSHLGDSCTLYIAPGVYWVDDPDNPEIAVGKDGREPFGCVIRCRNLRLLGLDGDARNTVLASQRGQTQGAIGNFTMLDIWCDSLKVENLTLGNYCNVDLDYPLNPALSRKKRSDAITQAHVGYVHGKSLTARNVRFISRLNLNPLNGAKESLYEDCHFECTDDAMNGTALYRRCEIDLYGQKPFWSTFGRGAMFVDCDFNVKGNTREMYFCKQGGPVTLIDCRYHSTSDSIYIGWTAYPQKWLRCYQKNFTLNGKPYLIGSRQPENTLVMDSVVMDTLRPPYLSISRHEAEMQVGGQPLVLHASAEGRKVVWSIRPPYDQMVTLGNMTGDSVVVSIACDDIGEPVSFPVTAYAAGDGVAGGVAVCQVTVKPAQLPAPAFIRKPRLLQKHGEMVLDYALGLDNGLRDESRITWLRDGIPVSVSHDVPKRSYRLTATDNGRTITASIEPKTNRSDYGETVVERLRVKERLTPYYYIETDFSDFPCQWQKELLPGYWTVDGYKPADTAEYPWTFDTRKPMWEYGEGFNGAVGKGLLQAQRGARLMYTPCEQQYGDMTLTLKVDPTKTAGQGFGSATGQYMDVCLKFDTRTLTGYGLRIIRTTKHAKAVDFYLVEYRQGTVRQLTEAVSATCYRTGCTISLACEGNQLTAHIVTETPQPEDSTLPHAVDLKASVTPLPYGGIAIQHTGSCGESTTMLHHLKATWGK